MLETGTSGLMSGDEKRGVASATVPALVLDSTIVRPRTCLRSDSLGRSNLENLARKFDEIQRALLSFQV